MLSLFKKVQLTAAEPAAVDRAETEAASVVDRAAAVSGYKERRLDSMARVYPPCRAG